VRSDRHPTSTADRDVESALHELGNALSVVVGWLETARRGVIDDREVRAAIEHAHVRALRAHRIARRAIGGEVPTSAESLPSLVEEAVVGLGPMAAGRGVRLECSLPAELAPSTVRGGDRLLQVLTNLLLNALEVSSAGGCIELGVAREGDSVALVVRDEGPGIPLDERATLFARGMTRRPGGVGIGLSHAAELAAAEGGELAFDESASRGGAAFRVLWPLEPLVPPSGALPSAAPHVTKAPSLSGLRVLVLDDDAAVVELIDTVLRARGAMVVAAQNEEELRDAVERGPFDAALLDASPLGEGSDELLGRLCRESPSLHAILISGSRDAAIPSSLSPARTSWVHKPFEMSQIVDALHSREGTLPSP
jgi:CheY-like chemotaxis protein